MKVQEIRAIAKQHQINSSSHTKTELIHKTQWHEGNLERFGTTRDGSCDQFGCLWRDDCFDPAIARGRTVLLNREALPLDGPMRMAQRLPEQAPRAAALDFL